VKIVRSGALGEISHVHVWDVQNFQPGFGTPPDGEPPPELDWDFWVGPSPRVPYNPNRYTYHYWFFDYGGGWEVAWGAHHYDIVHWAMGVRHPVAATGTGGHFAFRDLKEWPDTFDGACEYRPGPVAKNGFLLTYTLRSGCAQPVEGRGHGKAFYGTNGVLILNRQGYEVRSETRDGRKVIEEKVQALRMKEHDAVRKHVQAFVDSVRSRRPPVVDVEQGHEATNPGHLMNIAWRLGRRVEWDAQTETIPGDPEANTLVSKTYRSPWALPQ
jgi:predicted dehydrogenase